MNPSFEFGSTSKFDPKFEFNSSATSKLGGSTGSSRPRVVRTRRSSSSKAIGSSKTREINQGFNPFGLISDNLTRISSKISRDDSGCEKDENVNKNEVFYVKMTSKVDKVLDSLDGNHDSSLSLKGCDNGGRLFGDTWASNSESKKDTCVFGQKFAFGNTIASDFVFGSNRHRNDCAPSSVAKTFPRRIENLNIDDSDKKFACASKGSINQLDMDNSSFFSLRKESFQINGNKDCRELSCLKSVIQIRYRGENSSGLEVFKDKSVDGSGLHRTSASSTLSSPFTVLHLGWQGSCMDETDQSKKALNLNGKYDHSEMQLVEFKTSAPIGNLSTSSRAKRGTKKGSVKSTLSRGKKGKAKELMPVLTNNFPNELEVTKPCERVVFSLEQGMKDDKHSDGECSISSISSSNASNKGSLEVSEVERMGFKCAPEKLDKLSGISVDLKSDVQSQDQTQHLLSTNLSSNGGSFIFGASNSAQGQANSTTHNNKKKNRLEASRNIVSAPKPTEMHDTSSFTQFSPNPRLSMEAGQADGISAGLQKGVFSPTILSPTSSTDGDGIVKDSRRCSTSPSVIANGASEACEKWRLRGNQAYANGNLEKAEDYYSLGLSCIPQNETSRDCLRALLLCYSNRAATRLSCGRMREALEDCLIAAEIDPKFFRVQQRAAYCHLALGEVSNALRYFKKLLQATDVCVERKLIIEASEGLQKAKKVSECTDHCAEFLLRRTLSDAESVLSVIAEALVISPCSEELLKSKAEVLFMLRRYEEVIHLCKQSLGAAERNSSRLTSGADSSNLDSSEISKAYAFRLWRYCFTFKSYFSMGKLEESLDFLEKQEQWRCMVEKYGIETLEPLIPQISTVRELIRHESAGSKALQEGRHAEAIEHYTTALALNIDSHPFASTCFASRATAYKALGQIADAIADCSLAIALNENNMKAISTRATLFEMIRDYEKAAKDLQRIVSLLAKQAEEKVRGSSSPTNLLVEVRQARQRFYQMQEQATKVIPLNYYLILGLEPSITAADLRKAYRKAARKHHPDKAGQSLARSESGEERIQKETLDNVYEDTDKLFKIIAQAYAVLSDPTKRSQYDIEEEKRNRQRKNGGKSTSGKYTDSHSTTSERNVSNCQQWQEPQRSSNAYSRGYERSKSSGYYF